MVKRIAAKELVPLSELISLKGDKALITGPALGIGKAMAYRFAEAGADLEFVDMNERGLKVVAEELSKFKVGMGIHKVNLSSREEINILWEELKGKEPDILVNNAGIYPFRDFLEVDEAFFSKVMDINLKSTLLTCQHMIKRRLKKGGVIIDICSIEALMPFVEGMASYSISKAGVIALTRSLAKEYGKHGFRVNAIIPGGIITPGQRPWPRKSPSSV
jgi:3-oxoacyl-[acyl-carrier protein] reductase